MNTPSDNFKDDTSDHAVSAQYRRIATESAPEHLHKAVLHNANRTDAPGLAKFWVGAWLRPTVVVAVVGLSIALVFDLNYLDDASFPEDNTAAAPTSMPADSPFDAAAAATIEQIRAADRAARLNPGSSESPSEEIVDQVSSEAGIQPGVAHCSEQQKMTSGLWWQCIQSLESRGNTAAATVELEALLTVFPAFELP